MICEQIIIKKFYKIVFPIVFIGIINARSEGKLSELFSDNFYLLFVGTKEVIRV
jgi:hypothetical protein